jgi:hypothetical protein
MIAAGPAADAAHHGMSEDVAAIARVRPDPPIAVSLIITIHGIDRPFRFSLDRATHIKMTVQPQISV